MLRRSGAQRGHFFQSSCLTHNTVPRFSWWVFYLLPTSWSQYPSKATVQARRGLRDLLMEVECCFPLSATSKTTLPHMFPAQRLMPPCRPNMLPARAPSLKGSHPEAKQEQFLSVTPVPVSPCEGPRSAHHRFAKVELQCFKPACNIPPYFEIFLKSPAWSMTSAVAWSVFISSILSAGLLQNLAQKLACCSECVLAHNPMAAVCCTDFSRCPLRRGAIRGTWRLGAFEHNTFAFLVVSTHL